MISDMRTAYHESGHAVACVAAKVPFRYVTINPRSRKVAGQVVLRDRYCRMGEDFEANAVVSAAGIIAEDLHIQGNASPEHSRLWRRNLVQVSGRVDMKLLRTATRINYRVSRENADWIPESPVELAKRAWKRSLMIVTTNWSAVSAVACSLFHEKPSMSSSRVREIVAGSEVLSKDEVEMSLSSSQDWTQWFLEHSRLKWEPPPTWYKSIDEDIEWWRANG